jgi:nitrous oxidase accessory protein NosD
VAGAAAALSLAVPLSAGAAAPRAHTARSLSVKAEGHLRLVKSSGSLLIDEGPVTGTLPGRVKLHFTYNGSPTVSAQITIYGRYGSISARGSGQLSSPTSSSPSFRGNVVITAGSGRYAHASGSARFYGVFYRRTYAMTVQTEGVLHY